MSKNKENIKVGDRIKVISTESRLFEIGVCGVNLKGHIAIVDKLHTSGVAFKFGNVHYWHLRFSDVHKVVE